MSYGSATRRFAEKSGAQARSAFRTAGQNATEEMSRAEETASNAVTGIKEYYLRMLELARETTLAGFDLAYELATVKTPTQFVEVWGAHASATFDIFSKQNTELSALAQRIASAAPFGEPFTNGFGIPSLRRAGQVRD